jgi:hypothetical protein
MNKELYSKAKEMIINNGIKNLKEFGYPSVNNENIFTDAIYSQMFKRMLEKNKGEDEQIDIIIDDILANIK